MKSGRCSRTGSPDVEGCGIVTSESGGWQASVTVRSLANSVSTAIAQHASSSSEILTLLALDPKEYREGVPRPASEAVRWVRTSGRLPSTLIDSQVVRRRQNRQ